MNEKSRWFHLLFLKIHYLSGGAMLIQNNGVDSLLYAYSDFQGSLIALTDESGNVVEKYAYDPWGARRNADDWTQKDTRTKWITNRGYTGHEHLDAFGIINMNGRVYDPATGMFMSPDPQLQSPGDWLNYNRYGYCMGNPFKYTDPSGNSWISDIFNWVGKNWKTIVTTVATAVVAVGVGVLTGGMGLAAAGFFAGGAGGLISGALGTALNGGNLRDCFVAGLTGAAIGGVTGLLGGAAASLAPAGIIWGALYGAGTGAAIGGASSALSGGDFWSGVGIGAALGAIGGGFAGGQKALANGQNAWWGNDVKYNRNQWSFINTNKPDYEIDFGIKDVGSQAANDCVPTTFSEIDEQMGGSRTYQDFKTITNYQDEVGVLTDSKGYENLMHGTFDTSETLCRSDYSNLFNPDYMESSASNKDVFSFLFKGHADNVRSLQVFTRNPLLNTLTFRQSSYNFSIGSGSQNIIYGIFHISH